MMWVGDYRQKAPAAACDLKKGRKVPVGGSPAWRLPKIERGRDQSRRSQAAPPRRSEGASAAQARSLSTAARGNKAVGRKQETIQSDLRTSKQGRTLLSQSSQQDKTWGVQGVLWVPGSRDGCGTGLEATNDSSQWVRREAAGERQGSLAAGSRSESGSGSDSKVRSARSRKESPVVDGERVGRCWECLRGRTGRCRCQRRRTQRRMRQSRASDKVCLSIRSSPVRILLSSQICWLRYVENVECATLQQAMYVGMQCLAGQVRARMGKYARMERRCADNGRQTGRCQVVGYILGTVSRYV